MSDNPRHEPHNRCTDHHRQQHGTNHEHSHRRTQRPILSTTKLRCNHRADHVAFCPAQDGGSDVVATHGNECEQHTSDDSWPCQWKCDTEERGEAPGT